MPQPDPVSPSYEVPHPERPSHGLPPGDRVVRPARGPRIRGLRRVLGVGGLYSIGYGNVGSSIYYALGITAVYALGATPLALGIAGIFFIFTALTYAEGAALMPEAGGSSAFARRGFNELVSFVAGWVLMLDYIVTIAISAITVPFYLAYFVPTLKTSRAAATWVGLGVIFVLMLLNVIGVKESSRMNIGFTILDLATQGLLVLLGLALLLNLPRLLSYVDWSGSGNWPTPAQLIQGIAIAMVGYIGLESVSQMAEEAREASRTVPRSMMLSVVTVLVMYAGISTVALSAMSPQTLVRDWSTDPVAGIAHNLPDVHLGPSLLALSHLMAPWVALLAATILLIATNAGLLGISRLAFSMGLHRQLPLPLVRLHPRFRTPYIAIIFFSVIGMFLLLPGFAGGEIQLQLGEVYVVSAALPFAFAHASILALRVREPEVPRSFQGWWNIPIGKTRIPMSAVLGLLSTSAIWAIVFATRPWGRLVFSLWLGFGLVLYAAFRRRCGLGLRERAPLHPGSL